jgi:hypothetical protein
MNLRNIKLSLIVIFVCVCATSAQESKCTLKKSELPSIPELRGFYLGMTTEQVRARATKIQLRPSDEFGSTALNLFPDYESGIDKKTFEHVRTISLEFLDGRVSSLWIGYDQSFKWQSPDEFTQGFAAALKLQGAWRQKLRNRLLDCADFSVAVIPAGGSLSIKLVDEGARETLEKRKAAQEESQP